MDITADKLRGMWQPPTRVNKEDPAVVKRIADRIIRHLPRIARTQTQYMYVTDSRYLNEPGTYLLWAELTRRLPDMTVVHSGTRMITIDWSSRPH